MAAVL